MVSPIKSLAILGLVFLESIKILCFVGQELSFYNSKNLNCFWALSFFKICSHIFIILEVKLEW